MRGDVFSLIKAILLKENLYGHTPHPNIFPMHGGCINQVYKVSQHNTHYLLKIKKGVDNNHECEFHNLSFLIKHNIPAPRPISYGTIPPFSYLILEYMEKSHADYIKLAEVIASLHHIQNHSFGFHYDNYVGSIEQSNAFSEKWVDFYIRQRLLPLINACLKNHLLTNGDIKKFEQLFLKFPNILPEPTPSLIHGDLWHGNILFSSQGPLLIDPALYYSHHEVDIAMTLLFGGFNEDFYNTYFAYFPKDNEWEERIAIYQLYPLLIHLHLFGKSYYPGLMTIVNHFQ